MRRLSHISFTEQYRNDCIPYSGQSYLNILMIEEHLQKQVHASHVKTDILIACLRSLVYKRLVDHRAENKSDDRSH